jgi:glycerophosphoryl diester phosphodiesterase
VKPPAAELGRTLLIAHRGESRDAPENTLAAIWLAWERGAPAVEIDVRRSADGDLMVIHDADTRRIGGPRRPVRAQATTELRTLDAGAWKHRRWRGERIPLLAEVLATVPACGRLLIEVKEGPECVPPLVDALASARIAPEQAVVLSFDASTAGAAAQALPRHEVALLLTARQWTPCGSLARALLRAQTLGCRALDVQAHRSLNAAVVGAVHAAGLLLYCWTVNRVSTAHRLAVAGLDGITTDRCAWLGKRLR